MAASREPSEPRLYRKRDLAFIDVLGWKDIIDRSIKESSLLDPIMDTLGWMLKVRSTATKVQAAYRRAPFSGKHVLQEVAQFSDTIVMSCEPTNEAVGHLLYVSQQLCLRLLLSQRLMFTRGAIVIGDLVHRGNAIFGPALIEAHRLESTTGGEPACIDHPRGVEIAEYSTGSDSLAVGTPSIHGSRWLAVS
jgi:hypothetical protein